MTDLSNWKSCHAPDMPTMQGRFVRADLYDAARDGADLFGAIGGEANDPLWTHIPVGPFESAKQLTDFFSYAGDPLGWRTYVFRSPENEMLGTASYMRIRPEHGSAEVGSVVFSNRLKRTPAATEAMYLMARTLFRELGYRRYEWKCNAENEASKRAAIRFGFTYEGTFRNDMVVKGRNRDTCWYSMLESEWAVIEAGFEAWLDPDNFDKDGAQIHPLANLRADQN